MVRTPAAIPNGSITRKSTTTQRSGLEVNHNKPESTVPATPPHTDPNASNGAQLKNAPSRCGKRHIHHSTSATSRADNTT